jgi:hypothetical protein
VMHPAPASLAPIAAQTLRAPVAQAAAALRFQVEHDDVRGPRATRFVQLHM